MAKFDTKIFNGNVFGKYVNSVPNTKRNELIKSGVLRNSEEIKNMFSSQSGGSYATVPLYGLIDGEANNYDGNTDIESTETKTYQHSVNVVGRAKGWVESDFSSDITGGVSFMDNVVSQVARYWDEVDQKTILATLKGVFNMTGSKNLEFVNNHTLDLTQETTEDKQKVTAETLNNSLQKACGDNKDKFKIVIMHSAVSTRLENLNLMERLKYTDPQGIQRDLNLGSWGGRIVLIDDSMPTEEVAESSEGANDAYTKYTTYVLGEGSIMYEDVGAKVPYEMERNASKRGGQTTLYTRQRKIFAPFGISFTRKSVSTTSPTDAELANGSNWELINDSSEGNKEYINHKAIPIARIVSKG